MRIQTTLAAVLAAVVIAPAAADSGPLSGPAIAETVAGRRIYLQTPFGGEFPLHYRKDGVVDGSGEALGLGRFMAPEDEGKWWVAGDRLCQEWQEWYDGKRHCFTLKRTGEATLYWQRDDGLEGEARIGQ